MKKLLYIICFILLIGVIYLGIINADQTLNIYIWGIKGTAQTLNMPEISKNINFAIYTFFILLIGLITGIGWIGQFYLAQKEKLNAYKRELEKTALTSSSSSSRVEILEAKIATLEKALSDKLDK